MDKDKDKENESFIKELFQKCSPSQDKTSGNQTVSFGNIQNWMKGTAMFGQEKKIPEEETSSILSKIAKSKDSLNMEEFQKFLEELASKMKMKTSDLISSLKDVAGSSTAAAGKEKKGLIDNIKSFAGFKE